MSQTFYAALVLAGGASYGIISTLVKLSYRAGFSINDVSSIQYFLGFLLLWTIWLLRVRKFPAKKTALAFLLTGIPLSGTTMLYNHALEALPASLAVIFLFQSIWLGTLAECVIRREKPTRIRLLSIAIVLAGTVLSAGVVGSAAAFPLSIGMLWGLAAAISYTTGLLCMNRIGRGIHPITKSALMVSGALVMVLLFLPPDFPVSPAHFASILPYGIPLTLFGVFLPPLLFGSGIAAHLPRPRQSSRCQRAPRRPLLLLPASRRIDFLPAGHRHRHDPFRDLAGEQETYSIMKENDSPRRPYEEILFL